MRDFSTCLKGGIICAAAFAILLAWNLSALASASPAQAQWQAIAFEALREAPWDRKVFDTMSENFPAEMDKIVHAYIEEAKAGMRGRDVYLPRFPYRAIQQITARPEIIAAAPDAELHALARAMATYAEGYRAMPKSCSSLAVGGGLIPEPASAEMMTPKELMANADLATATILAARAALDRPVKRPVDPRTLKLLTRSFRDRFAGMLDLSADTPVAALPKAKRCDFLIEYYAWIAARPADQAAYFMTHARTLGTANHHTADNSPFKLVPVVMLGTNTQN